MKPVEYKVTMMFTCPKCKDLQCIMNLEWT
nr:MAG TPA: zinc-ribbon domain protein [Caudoviricetes sp.]